MRRANTARDIVATGEFIKAGRKHYQHGETGLAITYDSARWAWITPDGLAFGPLHAAVSWLRHCITDGKH